MTGLLHRAPPLFVALAFAVPIFVHGDATAVDSSERLNMAQNLKALLRAYCEGAGNLHCKDVEVVVRPRIGQDSKAAWKVEVTARVNSARSEGLKARCQLVGQLAKDIFGLGHVVETRFATPEGVHSCPTLRFPFGGEPRDGPRWSCSKATVWTDRCMDHVGPTPPAEPIPPSRPQLRGKKL
jgi:hypothetical protein